MKVILLKDVRGCGQANTVVDVADGYASNFLFPHKYAVVASDDKMKEMEAKKAGLEAARKQEEDNLVKKIQALEGKTLTIAARATEKGGLFKSLTATDIAKAIRAEHSLEMPEAAIDTQPIKTTGEHKVRLHSKTVKVDLTVVIAAQ
jgi:large subunit ribosomal protein L9